MTYITSKCIQILYIYSCIHIQDNVVNIPLETTYALTHLSAVEGVAADAAFLSSSRRSGSFELNVLELPYLLDHLPPPAPPPLSQRTKPLLLLLMD